METDILAHLAYLKLRNLSPNTVRQRHYALHRLARHLDVDTADLLAILPCDLNRWQHDIAHLAPRYRSSWQSHVKGFYTWALGQGLIGDDPSKVLVTVQLDRLLPNPIPEPDLDMAIRCAPERVRPWLVLAAYAGLRAAEVATLPRTSVQEHADPRVMVIKGKGGKERVVPMSQYVLDELLMAGMPSRGAVFARADGQPGGNRPWQVSHLTNDYLHSLGITHTIHSCRHRFGTELYRLTGDLRLVQEVMGHSSPAVTAGYAAYSNRAATEAMELLGGKAGLTSPREESRRV